MGILFTNNAVSSLQAGIAATDVALTISASDAAAFPQPVAATDYFIVTLEDKLQNPVLREVVKCTARVGNLLTIVRAQEDTTAVAFGLGVTVSHRLTAGSIQTIAAGVSQPVMLYLGAYATAPSVGVGNVSLIAGNLYFDTTLNTLRAYNGVSWGSVAPGGSSLSLGVYLGAFASAPLTMLDGSALVVGTIYFNIGTSSIQEWDGSGWINITTQTTTTTVGTANQTVQGNLTVAGNETVQGNEIVQGDGTFTNLSVLQQTATRTLLLNGHLLVDAGDVSGTGLSQNFPNGNKLQWGTGATNSGGTCTVVFLTPFALSCSNVQLTLLGNPINGTIRVSTAPAATGFSVFTETTGNVPGPTSFFWLAIGE